MLYVYIIRHTNMTYRSPYTIRNTLAQLNNLIALQIKSIEKNYRIIQDKTTHCQLQKAYEILPKEFDQLEYYVNKYKTIENAIIITNYTELPIQK